MYMTKKGVQSTRKWDDIHRFTSLDTEETYNVQHRLGILILINSLKASNLDLVIYM